MAHYSEMDFLFSIKDNREAVIKQTNNLGNTKNIFDQKSKNPLQVSKYVVYKGMAGTENIKKNLLKKKIYNNEQSLNPYIKLLQDFNQEHPNPGAGLRLKAADLVYLRDLGVYPINRMTILRRFPEGCFVSENLEEMTIEPISTVIGWIPPDKNFGNISFNETWTTTNKRFDVLISDIVKKTLGMSETKALFPVPDFAQGMLFLLYDKLGLLDSSGIDDSANETYEYYDPATITKLSTGIENPSTKTGNADENKWGLNKIPIGDPNVLQEGPFRNWEGQNIKSDFSFDFETTYEQKFIGEIDPGSAMLDILDNLYAMGTSNMVFYWGDNSPIMQNAKKAASGSANNVNAWWTFIDQTFRKLWEVITELFNGIEKKVKEEFSVANTNADKAAADKAAADAQAATDNQSTWQKLKNKATSILSEPAPATGTENAKNANATQKVNEASLKQESISAISKLMQTILTSTIAINRFNIRGSIELMTGGQISSTPWYLTIGNPYSPWLATNHILVTSAKIESGTEMGFNDQPQTLKITFKCIFSRSLGKQELMRMFNNTYRRTYNSPPPGTEVESWQTSAEVAGTMKTNVATGAYFNSVDIPPPPPQ